MYISPIQNILTTKSNYPAYKPQAKTSFNSPQFKGSVSNISKAKPKPETKYKDGVLISSIKRTKEGNILSRVENTEDGIKIYKGNWLVAKVKTAKVNSAKKLVSAEFKDPKSDISEIAMHYHFPKFRTNLKTIYGKEGRGPFNYKYEFIDSSNKKKYASKTIEWDGTEIQRVFHENGTTSMKLVIKPKTFSEKHKICSQEMELYEGENILRKKLTTQVSRSGTCGAIMENYNRTGKLVNSEESFYFPENRQENGIPTKMINIWRSKDPSGRLTSQSIEEHKYKFNPDTDEITYDKSFEQRNDKGELIFGFGLEGIGFDCDTWLNLLKFQDIV